MPEFREQADQGHAHSPHVDHDHDQGHGHDHGLGGPSADGGQSTAATLGNARVGRILGSGVQRSGATGAQQLDETVARAIEERRGGGQPLDKGVRRDMEANLGTDLSDVRVHTDSTAHELNESVSAKAFTTGSDVFFKQGTYDPGSSSGRELLGHELTHVVQQREGTSGLQHGEVSNPSDPAERDAESVGRDLASGGQHGGDHPAAAPGVAREAEPEEEELQGSWEPGMARQPAEDEEEPLQAAREPGVARQEDEEEMLQGSWDNDAGVAREAMEEEEEAPMQAAWEQPVSRQEDEELEGE